MRALLVAAALFSAAPSFADEALTAAIGAHIADCVSTGAVLAFGSDILREANPRGPIVSCALKPIGVYFANKRPEPERTIALQVQSALISGAVANNLLLWVAPHVGLAARAVTIAVTAGALWIEGKKERDWIDFCLEQRERIGQPKLACVYKKP